MSDTPISATELKPRSGRREALSIFVYMVGVLLSALLFYAIRDVIGPVIAKKMPEAQSLIMLGGMLPYLELGIGILLAWVLAEYATEEKQHKVERQRLAESLRGATDDARRRMEESGRMAQALQESEQRYRAIFEHASIGICQIAANGEWLSANKAMSEMLGYENPQELLAVQPDMDGKLFADAARRRIWMSKLNSGGQQGFEAELLAKNGRTVWAHISGQAVRDATTGQTNIECMMYDVTERREAELALIHAKEQADFANRSKSEFLANMSHELRTPLNAIIGFAEIIKGQMFGPVGQPQYVEYAKDIYDSGDLLLSLINDILDMSKIEAGKRALVEATLDIEKIVHSVVRLVTSRAKLGKLHLHVNVPKDMPALRGEEKALKQIITNLLTNAIKFTTEGGNVTLFAGVMESGRIWIRIEDTGIGIAPEDIATALQPFGQIESALSRKHQGTGLGLPLTKALVELHDGTLDIKSRLGFGTAVTITFPADRVVAKASLQV